MLQRTAPFFLLLMFITSITWSMPQKGIKEKPLNKMRQQGRDEANARIALGVANAQKVLDIELASASHCMPGQTIQRCPYCMKLVPMPGHNNGKPANSCKF